jgi:hypothetical protein
LPFLAHHRADWHDHGEMDAKARAASRPVTLSLRRTARIVAALILAATTGIASPPPAIELAVLGKWPSYGPGAVGPVPNQAALDRLIWMPGLDAGWDPQGLAFADASLLISAYRSSGMWNDRGPCRIFRVDPGTGEETGHFDIPAPCGHAGGVAYAGRGKLFVTDTHTLFEIDLDKAFDNAPQTIRIFPLGRGLKGAFAVSDKGAIWIGDCREDGPANAFKFALASIEALADGAVLKPQAASAVLPIASYAQGGAVADRRNLWLARSDVGWGVLDKLDPSSGHLRRRYSVPAGIEGIAFDHHGMLWAVSEAGARHLPWRYPFFPLIFRLDPARLAPAAD